MKATNKRYGKRKWINTPLSRQYKTEIAALRLMSSAQTASISAVGIAQTYRIQSVQGNAIEKAAAMAAAATNTLKAVNDQMVIFRKLKDEIKIKWGVK
jgi:hypothetical protein